MVAILRQRRNRSLEFLYLYRSRHEHKPIFAQPDGLENSLVRALPAACMVSLRDGPGPGLRPREVPKSLLPSRRNRRVQRLGVGQIPHPAARREIAEE